VQALIVGAGIGGLTAAMELHRLGVQVIVAEAASKIQPLGVGINLLPHGVGVLCELGLGEQLARTGIQTRAVEYRTQFGHLILRDPRGLHAGSPWPQYSIHRGQLQALLFEAVTRIISGDRMLVGHRLEYFEQAGSRVTSVLRRRYDGQAISIQSDMLIGADGVQSTLCEQLHNAPVPLSFSGTMMWRGAVEGEPFLDAETMVIAGHHDTKAVIYPISKQAAERGRSLMNWVAEIRVGEEAHYLSRDWNRRAKIEEFIDAFEDWHFDFLDIPALFRATPDIFVYPMVDRDTLPFWSVGRVTLLGDAAHPMYPIGANGASQAILDAAALAQALDETGLVDVEAALARYEARRLPATDQVVTSNRSKGPEAVLQLARERIHSADDDVEALISREEIDAITRKYEKIAGFDASTLRKQEKSLG
jgi:2-polyprenyl-6-methoxyphenol hydroxylase-like FAD-dependent oxidoreductase